MLESRNLTSHVHDDGFREIQLNGKQLFFLFMATTVVSVVIFLCGVLVGRGVRIERNLIASTGLGESSTTEATPVATAVPAAIEPAPASAPPTTAPPSSPGGDDELRQIDSGGDVKKPQAPEPPVDKRPAVEEKSAATSRTAAAQPKQEPAATAPASVTPPVAAPAPSGSSGQSLVVQVAAVNTQSEADTMARRLIGKGYSAYVAKSDPGVFRVRVGPFSTRREAEAAAEKIRRQEGKKPWITRG